LDWSATTCRALLAFAGLALGGGVAVAREGDHGGGSQPDAVLAITTVVVLGVCAQWISARARIPSILLLLVFGLAAGPGAELVFGRSPVDPDVLLGDLLLPLTSLAVAVILFEGGLGLRFSDVRPVWRTLSRLLYVGMAATWLLASGAAYLLGLLDLRLSLLLGAILVVTGPTVVGPLLRSIRPTGAVGAVLRWEGIVIDPLGATLALFVYEAFFSEGPRAGTLLAFRGVALTALVGFGIGALSSGLLIVSFRRFWFPDHLEVPIFLMVVLAAYTGSNLVQEDSGLLTATVLGIVVGNVLKGRVKHIALFKENLQTLLIGALFIVLAARLDPADLLASLSWRSLAFVAALVLVIRPASVLLATMGSPLRWPDRLFIAGMAPRGIVAAAVASVFALRLTEAGLPEARFLAPLTFVSIIATVCCYGLLSGPLARRLGLAETDPQGILLLGAERWVCALAALFQEGGVTVRLIDGNLENVTAARRAGLAALHANVLSDVTTEEIGLGGIGKFAAMTANDEVNALAAQRFLNVFGREQVYLLPPARLGKRRHDLAPSGPGRSLFSEHATNVELAARLEAGDSLRADRLTKELTFQTWRELYGQTALPLFVLSEKGRLEVFTTDHSPTPRTGDTLISMVPAREHAT
jgi:NhaP-type Na+/H+ or K+/H+ antiporter